MPYLHSRDFDSGNSWTTSGGARWAFFAIFIVLILIVVLGTLRVNRKRTQHGSQPLYGTRWMTPPSYLQSEHQQQRHNRDPEGSAYVPTYTAEATDNIDMGYYDQRGEFHPAKKSSVSGPTFTGLGSSNAEGDGAIIEEPEPAHRRQESGTDGIPISAVPHETDGGVTFSDEYGPPPGPPPTAGSSSEAIDPNNHPLYSDEDFLRPVGIPPRSTTKIDNNEKSSST